MPTSARPSAPWLAATAVLAALVVLTGCTKSTPRSGGAPATSSAVASLPAGVSNATSLPTKVPNRVALRKNVLIASCASAPGGWQATGTAANHSASPASYTVTVFFTTVGDTVIGSGATRVRVPGQATRPWSVIAHFTPAPRTLCVLRGVG